ncbi:septum formation inhibitor Maf [Bergeyella porcorum]|uniref:dTTP/UTP pyrophosphatase n=2 Tax=Bergeyella porcorum TaxID=1735111 RepID=A0AAU0F1L8_9FLAO
MMKLLLASQSARRKELLQSLGYSFETVSIHCDEIFPEDMPVDNIAGYLSKIKADAYPNLQEDEILLTADTIVALGNQVLGKPQTPEQAQAMLRSLSGKTHKVYTGITIRTLNQEITKTDMAEVTFSELSDAEIALYIQEYQPFDKAGSYGIQERIGMAKVSSISGSFYTIMGLPTHLVYEELEKINPR